MVNSPNSYWLSLFLKKEVNVLGWNYRGYGKTTGQCTPYNIKADGESVLHFLLDDLKLKGKIGVYGRSLGGVVATHLAATFTDIVHLLIADRTFGSLKDVSTRKFTGAGTRWLYDLITLKWESNNDLNFIKAKCFKITTCDPLDDVVD
jgi:pimeloyl-ACP methyl ester carboxylesterase